MRRLFGLARVKQPEETEECETVELTPHDPRLLNLEIITVALETAFKDAKGFDQRYHIESALKHIKQAYGYTKLD